MNAINGLLRLIMFALVVWFVAKYVPGAASVLDALRSDVTGFIGNVVGIVQLGEGS